MGLINAKEARLKVEQIDAARDKRILEKVEGNINAAIGRGDLTCTVWEDLNISTQNYLKNLGYTLTKKESYDPRDGSSNYYIINW